MAKLTRDTPLAATPEAKYGSFSTGNPGEKPKKGGSSKSSSKSSSNAPAKIDSASKGRDIPLAKTPLPKTADSTSYFRNLEETLYNKANANYSKTKNREQRDKDINEMSKASSAADRQQYKGKQGYNENGYPIK